MKRKSIKSDKAKTEAKKLRDKLTTMVRAGSHSSGYGG